MTNGENPYLVFNLISAIINYHYLKAIIYINTSHIMEEFITRCISLASRGNGTFQLNSEDQLIESGEYTAAQINQVINRLSKSGWHMVGSIDRKYTRCANPVVDLYFRKQVAITEG